MPPSYKILTENWLLLHRNVQKSMVHYNMKSNIMVVVEKNLKNFSENKVIRLIEIVLK